MTTYLIFFIVPMVLGLYAQHKVKSTFQRFTQVSSGTGLTGAQVARAILDRNGLHDVEVRATPGELSDHYDPGNRTVNLSEPVYGAESVSAVSVAAHEVGHAIQHARAYAPMTIRSAVFPMAALGTNLAPMLIMGGIVLTIVAGIIGTWVLLLGIVAYAFAVLFQLVTLPVEFDASRRAKNELQTMGLVAQQADGTRQVLNAAAMTYVAAALAALAQLMYFVTMFLNSNE